MYLITLNEIRNVLFSEKRNQQLLLDAMNEPHLSFDEALHVLFFEMDELSLQQLLAPFLRTRATNFIRESDDFASFRSEFIKEHGHDAFNDFLTEQNTNFVYGTDELARALAISFNLSLQITTLTDPPFSYAARDAEHTRPVVILYNQPESHWYIYEDHPEDTLGDGNCLFNSCAQILRNSILYTNYSALATTTDAADDNPLALFAEADHAEREVFSAFQTHIKIYQNQDTLRASFDKLPRLSIAALTDRIKNLSKAEKKDHLSALQIAIDDESTQTCTEKTKTAGKIAGEHQMNSRLLAAGNTLIATIQDMHDYGIHLQDNGKLKEGQLSIDLAAELNQMALTARDHSFYADHASLNDFSEFEKNFSTLLNSKNKAMRAHRLPWSVVVKNIAIALTGIGLLLIAGKLLYSLAKEGQPLLFFQKVKTTSEEKIQAVKESLDAVAQSKTQ
jgi:hypothetical protein